jgi:hypothetical protein
MVTAAALSRAARETTDILTGVFEAIAPIAAATGKLFGQQHPPLSALRCLDEPSIAALTPSESMIVGAGFVAAPGTIEGVDYWLQWWSDYDAPRTHVPQQLSIDLDPDSENFNDYTRLPWYHVPAGTGARHVTGPYVDYLCTDQYTLTFTIPITAAGRFVGVVGADVYAATMERAVYPALTELGEPAALLNTRGRVVAATRSPHTPGDLLRFPDFRSVIQQLGERPGATTSINSSRLERCAEFPLAVAAGPQLGPLQRVPTRRGTHGAAS